MDPKAYEQKMIATMKERTGKSLEEWLDELRPNLPAQKAGRLKWLKEAYGLGQNTAMVLLHQLENPEAESMRDEAGLTEAQYQGENAALKPLYDQLAARIQAFGDDVKIRPCKTYVPFYRKNVFVYIRPMKGQLHLGLALPEETSHLRLAPVGKLGGPERIKVKAMVSSAAEIDDELIDLIHKAYELN